MTKGRYLLFIKIHFNYKFKYVDKRSANDLNIILSVSHTRTSIIYFHWMKVHEFKELGKMIDSKEGSVRQWDTVIENYLIWANFYQCITLNSYS